MRSEQQLAQKRNELRRQGEFVSKSYRFAGWQAALFFRSVVGRQR